MGCGDGRVIVAGTKKGKTIKLSSSRNVGVDDVQWDPNSPNYLLASWKDGSMSLFDSESEKEMNTFERQGNGTAIIFISSLPSIFHNRSMLLTDN